MQKQPRGTNNVHHLDKMCQIGPTLEKGTPPWGYTPTWHPVTCPVSTKCSSILRTLYSRGESRGDG